MMTKEEHISHWLKSAEEDFETMNALFKEGRWTHSLFFGHLYIEKICKALWVKNNSENVAPFSHHLTKLVQGIDTGLTENDFEFLAKLNTYQLEGRYPEYTFSLKQITTKPLATDYINRINKISECLRKKL